LLVDATVAGIDLQLGAVSSVEPRVVEAFARYWVDQRAVYRMPLLVGAAGAGPQLNGLALSDHLMI
jgi:hypothetical protein